MSVEALSISFTSCFGTTLIVAFKILYLRLEYSSVARAIEHLFVGRWPEGPVVLKGGAMAPLARPSVYATHDSRTRTPGLMCFYAISCNIGTVICKSNF